MLLKIPVKLAELLDRAAKVRTAVLIVKGSRHDNHRRNIPIFNQVVKHIFGGRIIKILSRTAAPSVHQIEDIIPRVSIVFIIAIRRIDIRSLCNRFAVPHIILRFIIHADDLALPCGFRLVLCRYALRHARLGDVNRIRRVVLRPARGARRRRRL